MSVPLLGAVPAVAAAATKCTLSCSTANHTRHTHYYRRPTAVQGLCAGGTTVGTGIGTDIWKLGRTVHCASAPPTDAVPKILNYLFQTTKPTGTDTAPAVQPEATGTGTGIVTGTSTGTAHASSTTAAAGGELGCSVGSGVCGVAQIAANAPIQDRHLVKSFDATAAMPVPTDVVRSSLSSAPANEVLVAAIIDGHGGWQIADAVKRRLPQYIEDRVLPLLRDGAPTADHTGGPVPAVLRDAVVGAFSDLDEEFHRGLAPASDLGFSRAIKCGACVCCVFVTHKHVLVANTGDCKAVLSRDGTPVPLSTQHSADVLEERAKIKAAHPDESDAVVCKKSWEVPRKPRSMLQYPLWMVGLLGNETEYASCYVKGRLQPSRSFGDFHLKDVNFAYDHDAHKFMVKRPHTFPYITVVPDLTTETRQENSDEFIIIASDGVWDFLDNKEAVEVVRRALLQRGVLSPPSADASPRPKLDEALRKQAASAAATALVDAVLLKAEVTREEAAAMAPKEKRQKFDDTTVCVVLL